MHKNHLINISYDENQYLRKKQNQCKKSILSGFQQMYHIHTCLETEDLSLQVAWLVPVSFLNFYKHLFSLKVCLLRGALVINVLYNTYCVLVCC